MRRSMTAACATLALAAPAFAVDTASSSASVSFEFILQDLNPGDGIAPSIRFLETPGPVSNVTGGASNDNTNEANWVSSFQSGTVGFTPLSTSVDTGWARSSASIGSGGTYVASVSAWASSGGRNAVAGAESAPIGNYSDGPLMNIALSPYTALQVRGEVSLAADTTRNPGVVNQANAEVQLYLGNSDRSVESLNNVSFTAQSSGNFPTHGAFTQPLSVFQTNNTGQEARGEFRAYLSAVAAMAITPIPEPATWASLLAGIACLGFAGIRRRREGP